MIGVPLIVGVFYLQHEVLSFVGMVIRRLQAGYLDLPSQIKDLPVIGQTIKDTLWEINKTLKPRWRRCVLGCSRICIMAKWPLMRC